MSDFNEYNWKNALTELYSRSTHDPVFRQLCLSNPIAAVAQVSDIELPQGVKLQFFDKRADFIYAFLLPPILDPGTQPGDQIQQVINWSTLCTDYTTTLTHPE